MTSVVGDAFVRIRPDTRGFAGEAQRGIKSSVARLAGVAGIAVGVHEVINLVKEANKVERERTLLVAQANAALETQGKSWNAYGEEIQKVLEKQSELSGFDDEQLLQSFTKIFRSTHDVTQALKLNAIAADVARGRNMDLNGAAQLLVRANNGQFQSLKRLGIQIDANSTKQQAIAKVQKTYAGASVAFAESQLGAQARLNKVWDDTLEIVGGKLTPIIAHYQRGLAAWLDTANRSGETQKLVNEYMGTAVGVVKGVADAFQIAHRTIAPFVEALGGVERVAKLVALAFVARKLLTYAAAVRGVAVAFGFIPPASARATAAVVADATRATAAIEREGIAATQTAGRIGRMGAAARGAAGLAATGLALAPPSVTSQIPGGQTTTNIGIATLFGFSLAGPAGAAAGFGLGIMQAALAKDAKNKAKVQQAWNAMTYEKQQAVIRQLGEKKFDAFSQLFDLSPPKRKKVDTKRAQGYRSGGEGDIRETSVETATRDTRLTAKQVQGRLDAFDESITNAQIASDQKRERKLLDAKEAFIRAQLKAARLSNEERRSLKDALLSTRQAEKSIDDEVQAAADAAAAERQQKADARVAKEKAARAKRIAEAKKDAAETKRQVDIIRRTLSPGPYATTSSTFAGGRIAGEQAFGSTKTKTSKTTSTATAAADAMSIQDLFAAAVQNYVTYGSNIAGPGGVLSAQDARAQLGVTIMEQIAGRSLTEAQTATGYLKEIAQNTSKTPPPVKTSKAPKPAAPPPPPGALGGSWTRLTEIAADNWYEGN